jgi:nucleotide-binding universal stress UspA family protein
VKLMSSTSLISLKNILFATDFSSSSEAALPFVQAIACRYEAKLFVVHVLTPVTYPANDPQTAEATAEAIESRARIEMQRLETALNGVPNEIRIERDFAVWPTVRRILDEKEIDLVVVGTRGRTGARKLLMGSIAEEIFRQSQAPVLTIGPLVRIRVPEAAQFHRVLFATDFTPESLAAAPYALSLAQENQARLTLLHVAREPSPAGGMEDTAPSAATLLHQLGELVPADAESWCQTDTTLEYGDPADRILAVAAEACADLIVLGVRSAHVHLGAATHLGRAVAHKIVAQAACPVLTVRGHALAQSSIT